MHIMACSVSVDLETARRGISIFDASTKDCVKQFVGVHPEAAARENLDGFVEFYDSELHQIDGVGEIGLDRTYVERGVPYEQQRKVFEKMLSLAESSRKPVSIHSRKSLDDILAILPSFRIHSVLLHWFAGSKKQLKKAMDSRLFVSYGPALVYSEDKRVLLDETDRDRFLIETDGPVRYARCFEGYPALSTSFLPTVALAAARALGLTYPEVLKALEDNAKLYLEMHDKDKI
jgi:TatD DNase family protein